jgi:Zn-finger nucleic acid-binding protein
MLTCPRCSVPLKAHTITTDGEAWQVELDVCMDSCGGLWLEAHDFEVDPQAKLLLDQEVASLNIPRKKAVNTKAPADCPACRVPMNRYDWNNEGIHLDSCPMCQGRWLDGGEVRTIHDQWDKEPVSDVQLGDVMRQVAAVKKETEAKWQEENFWQWTLKRLMLTSTREKSK